ncbi:dynein axonemal intermediate chain 7 [Anabrus simplex]|uniref:dynein axonemal intermediate chain 7 n=1 Tax=Anabrus simplex TaxID=316456 RepID=UPI0035A3C112
MSSEVGGIEERNARRWDLDKMKEKSVRDCFKEHVAQKLNGNAEGNAIEEEWTVMKNEISRWKRYLKCDGLPDPASVQQMHIYLHMWQNDDRLNDIDHVLAKSDEVIRFTEVLDELIENPLDNSERKVELWKEIRNSIRSTLQQHLDTATYILLRCVERNLTFITDQEVFYERITPHFTLCLWGILPPPPTYSPEEQPKKIKFCSFDQLGITVQTPESLGDVDFILRALHLKYDHYSDRCPSWPTPSLPETYSQDLYDVVQAEWEARKILQINVDEEFEERIKRRQMIIAQYAASARPITTTSGFETRADKKGSKSTSNAPEPEPDYPALLQEVHDLPPIQTAAERYREKEDEVAKLLKVDLLYSCNDDELNLRKFRILNGVLFVDMLRQLPQPRNLPHGYSIHHMTLPQELEPVDFHIKYTPPPPPEPGQRRLPEEIEAELKKQEEQLEKLILVNITLPETVLWFEPPFTVLWDEEKGYWSTAECHDFKFNEDKQILTFCLGRSGLLGLAAYRYCNFPFQTWEIKPDFKEDKVVLSITAAIVSVEFTFKEEKVCLSLLQNGATNALQEIVGVYYDPHVLVKKMRLGGVDLFPESDTLCYVEGANPKHQSAENHLYHCMAMFCLSHNFTWSRWNLQAGRRNMVLRMREYLDRKRLPSQNTVHVTPFEATIVDCSEMSQCFNPTSLHQMKFYADLYHLIQDNFTIMAKNKSSDTSFKLIESIYEMLKMTRVLSYS